MSGRERRRELDDLDRALVAALKEDGRAPNVELAKHLGVSEKTVRNRIARLQAEHGLTITAELAHPGPRSRMAYLVHTEPGRRFHVADYLAARPEVDQVHVITGAADVLINASFPDDATALRFQVETVENHPGVRSAQSCHLIGEIGGSSRTDGLPGPQVDTRALAGLMIGPPRYADLDQLTDAICDAAVIGLGADRALVVSLPPDDNGKRFTVARRRGVSERYVDELVRRVTSGRLDGIIKRVWDTRQHVVVADARTDPMMAAAHDMVRAEGYVTLLTLPVLYGDSIVATISMYYDRLTTLDDEYVATAQGVADHFAVALARMLGLAPAPPVSEAVAGR